MSEANRNPDEPQTPAPQAELPPADAETVEATPEPAALDEAGRRACRRFGLDVQEVLELGETGRKLAARLAEIDRDLSRRYGRLGRLEERLQAAPDSEPDAAPDSDSPAEPPAEPAAKPDAPAGPAEESSVQDAGDLAALREQIRELKRDFAAFRDAAAEARSAREAATIQSFFDELDPQAYPQFAPGPGEDPADDAPAAARRRELVEKARQILRGAELAGEPLDLRDALRQGLAILAPDAAVHRHARRLADALDRRAATQLARPAAVSAARPAEPSVADAREAIDHWQKARGVQFFLD